MVDGATISRNQPCTVSRQSLPCEGRDCCSKINEQNQTAQNCYGYILKKGIQESDVKTEPIIIKHIDILIVGNILHVSHVPFIAIGLNYSVLKRFVLSV